jgi:hypothetical protein
LLSINYQSLCGVLAFCTRAIPAGRAFSRSLYMATSKAKKPFHLIRITKEIFNDLIQVGPSVFSSAIGTCNFLHIFIKVVISD